MPAASRCRPACRNWWGTKIRPSRWRAPTPTSIAPRPAAATASKSIRRSRSSRVMRETHTACQRCERVGGRGVDGLVVGGKRIAAGRVEQATEFGMRRVSEIFPQPGEIVELDHRAELEVTRQRVVRRAGADATANPIAAHARDARQRELERLAERVPLRVGEIRPWREQHHVQRHRRTFFTSRVPPLRPRSSRGERSLGGP